VLSWALSNLVMRSSSSSPSLTSKEYRIYKEIDLLIPPNRYISNIEMPGGTIRYVPLHPPQDGATRTSPASEWTINFEELENAMNPKTKMIVSTQIQSFDWFKANYSRS